VNVTNLSLNKIHSFHAIDCTATKLEKLRGNQSINQSIRKIFNMSRITNVIARSTENKQNIGKPNTNKLTIVKLCKNKH